MKNKIKTTAQLILATTLLFTSCKKKDDKSFEDPATSTTTGSTTGTPTVNPWSVIIAPTNTASSFNDLRDVHFFNKNNGIAVGWNDLVVKTNNGGTSWQLVPSFTNNELLNNCFMTDSLTAYVLALQKIYKTTNGCSTWVQCAQSNTTTIGGYSSIYFINSLTGFVGGDQGIMKTTDGGNTWTKIINSPKLIDNLKFTSATIAWASSQDSIYRSTNGGNTWQFANASYTVSNRTYFYDDYKAVRARKLIGAEHIINTVNAGGGWATLLSTQTSNYFLNDICYSDASTLFACTDNLTSPLQTSINSGFNWSFITIPNLPNNATLNKLFFTSPTTGFAVGGNGLIIKYKK
jgi:photosystem II stability/assembly factor-like uncharacterized protein